MTTAVAIPKDISVTKGVVFKPRQTTKRVIVHDSHTTPDIARGEEFLFWGGLKRGLMDVGYHFIINRDGSCLMVRDHRLVGTHTPGHNLDSIGVCLMGGQGGAGPEDNFTVEQKDKLLELLAWLSSHYSLSTSAFIGHTEVQRYKDRFLVCPQMDMDDVRTDLSIFNLNYLEHAGALPQPFTDNTKNGD
jgi:N-acetylmuramoyl-L-alanine amidase